jgi:hypothetical protein
VSEAYTQVSVVLKSTKSSPHEVFSILQRPIIKYHTRTLHSMSLMAGPILGLYGLHVDIADCSKPIKNERFRRKS